MEAIKVLAKILTNILTALYEPFGFSLLLSFLAEVVLTDLCDINDFV